MTMTSRRPHTNGVNPPTIRAAVPRTGAEALSRMPVVVQFDDSDSHADALDGLILAGFLNGSQRHARSHRLDRDEAAPIGDFSL